MAKKRLHEIDSMTGLALVLVVLGHLANPVTPVVVGSDFYFGFKNILYEFHMPFFMFLSGIVFYYSYKPAKTIYEYLIFIKGKFIRLIPPFLFFGTLMFLGKMIISEISHVENFTSNDIMQNFYKLFFMPTSSFARSLWYIYILFEYYVIFSLAVLIFKKRLYVLVILGVTLYFAPIQNNFFLGLNQFAAFFLFFSFGILFLEYYENLKVNFMKYRHIYMLFFLASFSFMGRISHHYSMFIIGSCSIPAIYGYVAFYLNTNYVLQKISKYTFSIYLMNMIFSGLIIAILAKIIPLRDMTFNVLFPLIAMFTIVGIIFVKKNIFKYLPILDRMTK